MKKSVLSLLAAAGCTAMAGTALAQWTPAGSPFVGPYEVYPVLADTTFKSIDLGGEVCPAGTYTKATMSADWNRTVASLQWQNDIRFALTDAPVSGTSTIPGTVYYGGVNGAVGTTATANNTPGTILWTSVGMSSYAGASPLHLAYRTNYNGGTAGIQLSNIAITISPPPPPPSNADCASAEDISAAANAALTGVNTAYAPAGKDITGADPNTLAVSPFSCQPTVSRITWYKYQPSVTRQYLVGTCSATAVGNNMLNNVVGVMEAGAGDPCVGMTEVACTTTACTGGVSTLVTLDSSKTYYIAAARTGATALGGAEVISRIFISVPDAATCGANTETEPNDLFANSNSFTMASGDTICGTTTGTTSANTGLVTSYDRFLIKTASHAGIKRNTLRIASVTAGHSLSIMGLNQTAGVIGTTDTALQTAVTTTTPARAVSWYTFGNSVDPNDRVVSVRVGGAAATTAQYSANLDISDVTPVTLSRDIKPGSVALTTRGQGHTSDTEIFLFDSNFVQIGNCDDSKVDTASAQSDLSRTLTAGTYYIAVGTYNTATNLASLAADDDFLTGNVMRYTGTLAHGTGVTTLNQNVAMKVTDVDGDVLVPLTLTDTLFNVAWVKMEVVEPVIGNGGCQPADIADDTGAPLPSDGSNTGVNEGDYNAFFAGFFEALAYCDQWDDAGNPLPSAGTNSGVNEGDYNGFFATFFNGCP